MSFFLPISRTFTQEDFTKDPTMFIRVLNKFSQDVANCTNIRTIGKYSTQATPCGNKFFYIVKQKANDVSRKVLIFDSIASGTTTIPIDEILPLNVVISAVYGMAQNSSTAVPLPYVNVTTIADSLGLSVNLTSKSVVIQASTANWTTYSGFIVLEYY